MPAQPTRQWWVPGDGIAREVIVSDIQRYLGPDALVRPGRGQGEHQNVDGYWITAYRTLTSQMLQDLRLDSQRFAAEARQGRVSYQDSRTHQSRQYYGPTSPEGYGQPLEPQGYPPQQQGRPPTQDYQQPPQQGYNYPQYAQQPPAQVAYQQGAQYVTQPGTYPPQAGRDPRVAYAGDVAAAYAQQPPYAQDPRYAYPPGNTGAATPQQQGREPVQSPQSATPQYYNDPRYQQPAPQQERRRR